MLCPTQASDPLSDLPLLQYYATEWTRYTTGANYVNRLFSYLNRHWVKREKDEGRKGVYQIYIVRPLLRASVESSADRQHSRNLRWRADICLALRLFV